MGKFEIFYNGEHSSYWRNSEDEDKVIVVSNYDDLDSSAMWLWYGNRHIHLSSSDVGVWKLKGTASLVNRRYNNIKLKE